MSFLHELGCGAGLGSFAVADLRLRSPWRDGDLELDEELHPSSGLDELLAAVDVEGGACDRGIRHQVEGQRSDVGWVDDTADRQRRTELLAAGLESVTEQRSG